MRRNVFCLGVAIGLAALQGAPGFAIPAEAGAWTPDAGHGEIIVTTLFDQANTAFDQAGRFTPTPHYQSLQATAFIDYGVTDWLAALIKPSVQASSLGAPLNQRFTGLGDSEIGAQARLWRDNTTVVSASAEALLPTSAGAGSSGSGNSWLPGDNHAGYDFRLLLGKNVAVGALPGFVEVEGAYRLRGGPAPDEAHADLTFGLYATPRLMLLAQSFNVASGPSNGPVFPHWAQSKLQLSFVYRLDAAWRTQVGGFAALAGDNAWRENGVLVALWRQF